ncbi:MAG: ERCC4 domain-containing protein [Thermoplasmata archaeon]
MKEKMELTAKDDVEEKSKIKEKIKGDAKEEGDVKIENEIASEENKEIKSDAFNAVKEILSRKPKQLSLVDFPIIDSPHEETKDKLIVDTREFNSEVVKELSKANLIIVPEHLSIGDYLISDRVAVERKTTDDFVKSIIDGRLFQQAKELKNAYLRPVLIVEGTDLYTSSGMNASSIRGAISSLILDYGIPVVSTKDAKDTAEMLISFLKRERSEGRTPSLRPEKGSMNLHDRQQYIVEGLPNISGTLAQRLLSHFGSVVRVMNASEEELANVKGIGKKTAKEIYDTLRSQWLS